MESLRVFYRGLGYLYLWKSLQYFRQVKSLLIEVWSVTERFLGCFKEVSGINPGGLPGNNIEPLETINCCCNSPSPALNRCPPAYSVGPESSYRPNATPGDVRIIGTICRES